MASASAGGTEAEIRAFIAATLAVELGIDDGRLADDVSPVVFGADSVTVLGLIGAVERRFGVEIDETAFTDTPTIGELTRAAYRATQPTMPSRFMLLAHTRPDDRALILLDKAGDDQASVTYRQLSEQALTIAGHLADTTPVGALVLVAVPDCIGFAATVLGCMLSRRVAVPVYPPQQRNELERFRRVVEQAGASLLVCSAGGTSAVREVAPGLAVRSVESLLAAPRAVAPAFPAPDDLAFVQFTSGSISEPRGVMVTHRNLMSNIEAITAGLAIGTDARLVTWLPVFHDLGLVFGVLSPLVNGCLGASLRPADFIKDPSVWIRALSRLRATHTAAPTFAYRLAARKVTASQLEGIDLRRLRAAVVAAEPVYADTLRLFCERFAPAGFAPETFLPGYGLAEITVAATGGEVGRLPRVVRVDRAEVERGRARFEPEAADAMDVVSCGSPFQGVGLEIVDARTRARCPDGIVGEIWLCGPSVAAGYLHDEGTTGRHFGLRLEHCPLPHLRTGDLGFVLDGELYWVARAAQTIVMNGRNHYAHDVEHVVEGSHPSVRPGGVCAFALGTQELAPGAHASERKDGVALVVEVAEEPSARKVADAVLANAARIVGGPIHDVVLVPPRSIPKTTSGKCRRGRCKELLLRGELRVLYRSSESHALH